jgi:hypothetical protein
MLIHLSIGYENRWYLYLRIELPSLVASLASRLIRGGSTDGRPTAVVLMAERIERREKARREMFVMNEPHVTKVKRETRHLHVGPNYHDKNRSCEVENFAEVECGKVRSRKIEVDPHVISFLSKSSQVGSYF